MIRALRSRTRWLSYAPDTRRRVCERATLEPGKHKTPRARGLPWCTRGLVMVGATGFEPATSCSRSRRATGLRYAPPNSSGLLERFVYAPGGIRTPNLLIRSQMLYPVELRALTIRRSAAAGDRMQTRKVDRARCSVNPSACA